MVEVDRISALPLVLKISILSLLDIKCILRTSVLSRSWRHVWTHLHKLCYGCLRESSATILSRVDHLLSSLLGPILRFALILHTDRTTTEESESESASASASIQRFLQIIHAKGALCNLCILNTNETVQFRLPPFDSLQELELWHCSIQLPHDFQGFKCLKNLVLKEVSVSESDLQLLINRSRKLTTTRLSLWPTEPMSVTFSSPLLTELHVRILDYAKSVKVVFAPCLREVHIIEPGLIGEDFNFEENVVRTLRFMNSIASVSSLSVDFFTLPCLSFLGEPVACPLRVHFHQLKCLRLEGRFAIANSTFYNLLKSTPFIERLEIKYYGDADVFFGPVQWDECRKQDGFFCLDQTLKSVKIITVTFNSAISIWMPHFFLVNATVLKLMEIEYVKCSVSELKMMDELHEIKPVSSDVKLMIGRYKFGSS